jgi:GT2 family glycosyltransferase
MQASEELNDTLIVCPSERAVPRYGAVAIGRNEGIRLKTCLDSLARAAAIVYVDSGSTDGSVQVAKEAGAEVIVLDTTIPFTAARARNAGFQCLQKRAPDLGYVQFIDADCELIPGWTEEAISFLEPRRDISSVCGILRERHPERSVYNWLCDQEWNGPVGEIRSCAGNAIHRASALKAVGGYREDVIAAEEDELCVRLRAANWRIWRIDKTMALHDASMTRFGQWFRRTLRAGYAFAQGSHLHGKAPEHHFVWQTRRALLWGFFLPSICVISGCFFGPIGWTMLAVFPLQVLRLTLRGKGSLRDRALVAFFQVLARFPEAIGQARFLRDRLFGRRPTLIEHK